MPIESNLFLIVGLLSSAANTPFLGATNFLEIFDNKS